MHDTDIIFTVRICTLFELPYHPAQWEAQMRLTLDTNLVYKVNTIVYTWN